MKKLTIKFIERCSETSGTITFDNKDDYDHFACIHDCDLEDGVYHIYIE